MFQLYVTRLTTKPIHLLPSSCKSSSTSSHVLSFCVTPFLTCCSYLISIYLHGILLKIYHSKPSLKFSHNSFLISLHTKFHMVCNLPTFNWTLNTWTLPPLKKKPKESVLYANIWHNCDVTGLRWYQVLGLNEINSTLTWLEVCAIDCPTVTGVEVVMRRVVADGDDTGLGAGRIGTTDWVLPIPLSEAPVKL
jgi:hypothetical protein